MSLGRYARNNVEGVYLTEDTSAANSPLVLETEPRSFARVLTGVEVACSAPASVTATTLIKRPTAGKTLKIPQADLVLSAASSGAAYADVYLRPGDAVQVIVPAAGAGITCSAIILEEARGGLGILSGSVGAEGVVGFEPLDLPGLARWGEPSTLPASGAIASWPDSSAAGNDATQAVEADKPTVTTLGTEKASDHALDDDWLIFDTEVEAISGQPIFFAAAVGLPNSRNNDLVGGAGLQGIRISTNPASEQSEVYVDATSLAVVAGAEIFTGFEGVVAFHRDGSAEWRVWKREDGGAFTEISNTPPTVKDGTMGLEALGSWNNTVQTHVGSIGGHVIAVGSALTDTQIEDTINFLYESQGFV